MSGDQYERYSADLAVLAAIGAQVLTQGATDEVAVPRATADAAVTAWNRDELDQPAEVESQRQSALRQAAGDLALIGLAIEERGKQEPRGHITVHLSDKLLEAAVRAAR